RWPRATSCTSRPGCPTSSCSRRASSRTSWSRSRASRLKSSRLAPVAALIVCLGAAARSAAQRPAEPEKHASPSPSASASAVPFQGSYSQPKTEEPAYGGHASAMGPPPAAPAVAGGPSPVQFEAVPGLGEKAYCGGRTKDSLLESGGSGVALLDYDG